MSLMEIPTFPSAPLHTITSRTPVTNKRIKTQPQNENNPPVYKRYGAVVGVYDVIR